MLVEFSIVAYPLLYCYLSATIQQEDESQEEEDERRARYRRQNPYPVYSAIPGMDDTVFGQLIMPYY